MGDYMGRKADDLTNKIFGFLKVIKRAENRNCKGIKRARWLCICRCGNEIIVDAQNLKQLNTISCGCYKKNVNRSMHIKKIRTISGLNRINTSNKAGFQGVIIKNKKYIARINYNKKRYELGSFDTPQKAFEVYKKEKERLLNELKASMK